MTKEVEIGIIKVKGITEVEVVENKLGVEEETEVVAVEETGVVVVIIMVDNKIEIEDLEGKQSHLQYITKIFIDIFSLGLHQEQFKKDKDLMIIENQEIEVVNLLSLAVEILKLVIQILTIKLKEQEAAAVDSEEDFQDAVEEAIAVVEEVVIVVVVSAVAQEEARFRNFQKIKQLPVSNLTKNLQVFNRK